MKSFALKFLALTSAFFSQVTFAVPSSEKCPDLVGQYECSFRANGVLDDSKRSVSFEKKSTTGIFGVDYFVSPQRILMVSVPVFVPLNGALQDQNKNAWAGKCMSEKEVLVIYKPGKEEYIDLAREFNYHVDDQKKLIVTMKGLGDEHPMGIQAECEKLSDTNVK